jgi:hypothetical protein
LKKTVWQKQVANYVTRLEQVEHNLKATFAVIWGQCSESMRAKLKTLPVFEDSDSKCDCIWLLKSIRGIMLRFEGQRYIFLSLDDALQNLCAYKQGPETTMTSYLEEFRSLVETFEHYGGEFGTYPTILETFKEVTTDDKTKKDAPKGTDTDDIKKIARNKALAIAFLKRADRRRYGVLWTDLENQYSRGNDQYPADLTEAYGLLVSFKAPRTQEPRAPASSTVATPVSDLTGLTFAQTTATVPGTDNVTHSHITCYECKAMGHYSSACPSATAVQLLQISEPNDPIHVEDEEYGFTFTKVAEPHSLIPSTWILLDSQSTISVFKNKHFLNNIRNSTSPLKVYTNGGTQTSTLVGDVTNFGTVWYNPQSLANILSLADVRKICRVTMDTAVESAMCVHKADGSLMKFIEYTTGLYYFDTAKTNARKHNLHYTFVTTVNGNKSRFHRREVEGADRARALYKKIGRPSQQHFEHILRNNIIRNCPVTVDDAKRAIVIYGPDVPALKGKSTKSPAIQVPTFTPVPIPAPILQDHADVTLCMDFFFLFKAFLSFIPSREKSNFVRCQ